MLVLLSYECAGDRHMLPSKHIVYVRLPFVPDHFLVRLFVLNALRRGLPMSLVTGNDHTHMSNSAHSVRLELGTDFLTRKEGKEGLVIVPAHSVFNLPKEGKSALEYRRVRKAFFLISHPVSRFFSTWKSLNISKRLASANGGKAVHYEQFLDDHEVSWLA